MINHFSLALNFAFRRSVSKPLDWQHEVKPEKQDWCSVDNFINTMVTQDDLSRWLSSYARHNLKYWTSSRSMSLCQSNFASWFQCGRSGCVNFFVVRDLVINGNGMIVDLRIEPWPLTEQPNCPQLATAHSTSGIRTYRQRRRCLHCLPAEWFTVRADVRPAVPDRRTVGPPQWRSAGAWTMDAGWSLTILTLCTRYSTV